MKTRATNKRRVFFLLCALIILLGGWAYVASSKTYYYTIPVTFNDYEFPVVEAEIEGKSYKLTFNTCSLIDCALSKEILASVRNKQPYGVQEWRNIKGEWCQAPRYLIPELKIGSLVLKDVIVTEESRPGSPEGSIGTYFVKKFNVLLNCKESVFVVSNDTNKLNNLGFHLDKMIKVPFKDEKKGLLVQVTTDLGTQKLSVVTSATCNALRKTLLRDELCNQKEGQSPHFKSSQLIMAGYDFGPTNFVPYDIPDQLEVDGFLGMAFLHRYTVYIDYGKGLLFINQNQFS